MAKERTDRLPGGVIKMTGKNGGEKWIKNLNGGRKQIIHNVPPPKPKAK